MTKDKKSNSFLIKVGVVLASTFILFILIVQIAFKYKKGKSPLPHTMIWDHRGLQAVNDSTENTLISYDRALSLGAEGIEMDIFFDDSLSTFVVSHDKPYQLQRDSSILILEDVFEKYGRDIYYWLDLKNLKNSNLKKVESLLVDLLKKHSLSDKVYTESSNTWAAHKLSKNSQLNIVLWIQYSSKKTLISWIKKLYYKTLISLSDFSGVSRGYVFADMDFRDAFSSFPCFIFHIYTEEQLRDTYSWIPNGSVLLVDNPSFYKIVP